MTDHSEPNSHEQQAINAMESGSQLSAEAWQEMRDDESSLSMCDDLLAASFVLAMDSKRQTPPFDVDRELAAFKEKKRRQRIRLYLRTAAGMAAALLVGIAGYYLSLDQPRHPVLPEPVLVFQAEQTPQSVMLDRGDGHKLSLHTHEVNLAAATPEKPASAGTPTEARTLKPHTLTIPRGETFKITLCDGTEVWLNANTYFVYPTAFVGRERVVTLQGEAYFKVAHNERQPFIVKTPHVQTRVLGTEFNVRSYSPEDTHVVLVDGRVEVRSTAGGSAYTPLEPGEDAHLQPDGNFLMTEVDLNPYIYWKEGYFYFDRQSLKDIMEQVGSWYNVNIQFRNPAAMHHKMHFVADRNKPLEHTLNLLNRMKKVTATVNGNTVTID